MLWFGLWNQDSYISLCWKIIFGWIHHFFKLLSFLDLACWLVLVCAIRNIFCKWLHQSWLLLDGLSLFGQSICSSAPHHSGQLSLIRIVPDQISIVPLIKSQGPRPPPLASLPFAILVQWASIPNVVMANCPNFWMTWKDTRRRLLRLHMHNAMIAALKSNENIKYSLASIVPVLVGSVHWAKCQFDDCPICEKLETEAEVGRQEPYAVKAGTTTTALPPIQMHCTTIIAPVLHWLRSVRVAPLSVNELKPVAGVGIRYSVSPPQTGHLWTSLLQGVLGQSMSEHLFGLWTCQWKLHPSSSPHPQQTINRWSNVKIPSDYPRLLKKLLCAW